MEEWGKSLIHRLQVEERHLGNKHAKPTKAQQRAAKAVADDPLQKILFWKAVPKRSAIINSSLSKNCNGVIAVCSSDRSND